MKQAIRLKNIEPFHVMDLLAKAQSMQASGRDIIHLEVGEPDFKTPQPVINAGVNALQAGQTHYTAATGLPALKSAIAQFYLSRYGKAVDPDQIIITPGASGALQLICSLLINPNENLLLTDPGYPCNRHFLANLNADGIMVSTQQQDDFHLTPELVEKYWQQDADNQTVGALVASPANPTGCLMNETQLTQLHQAIRQKQGILIVDEIYHGLTYGSDATTAVGLGDDVFVINSFSKYFAMTGWRLGWLVAPQWAIKDLDKLAQNLFLAPSTPAQYAALAAFETPTIDILESRREEFAARLAYLLPALEQLGFKVPAKPNGAFYIYADIRGLAHEHNQNSMQFCLDLLEQEGVAITPGIDFSHQHGEYFVRFAYTQSVAVLTDAVARIAHFLKVNKHEI